MPDLGLTNLGLFAATVLVINATPGVDTMLAVSRTLQHGVRGGLAATAGIVAGCAVHTLAAASGLAALLAASALAFSAIKWAGAAYLLWLAWGLLREALSARQTGGRQGDAALHAAPVDVGTIAAPAASAAPVAPLSAAALFRQGLLTNVLNPKVALFFLALLPQFIAEGSAHKTLAFVALGAWFMLQGWLYLAALVPLVAPLRRWRPRPGVERLLKGTGGMLFALLAARLTLVDRAP